MMSQPKSIKTLTKGFSVSYKLSQFLRQTINGRCAKSDLPLRKFGNSCELDRVARVRAARASREIHISWSLPAQRRSVYE